PRATPETADTIKPIIKTAIMLARTVLVISDTPATIVTPSPICNAAIPSAAAVPKSVAIIAKMSTRRPAKPSVWRAPNRRRKIDDMSKLRPRRGAREDTAPPTRAYLAHAWKPQWKSVCAKANCIASVDSGALVIGGGELKYVSGSAGPQNITPMPRPAAKSIATQENVENSGFSPSLPSGILPYRVKASAKRLKSTIVATALKSQLRFVVTQP